MDLHGYPERYRVNDRAARREADRCNEEEGELLALFTTPGAPTADPNLVKRRPESCIDYGRVIKHREGNWLVAVIWERVFGNPTIASISTSRV